MTSSKKTSNKTSANESLYKYYDIDRLNAKEKDKITIDKILLIKDKGNVSIGKPYIKNAKIELEVLSHKRDKKITVYKMRPKKKDKEKNGSQTRTYKSYGKIDINIQKFSKNIFKNWSY